MDQNILRASYFKDLICRQGTTFYKKFTFSLQESDGTLTPINLTGLTARMQVRKRAGSPVVVELTTVNGKITLGGVAGTIELNLSAADTQALPIGVYAYDIELVEGTTVARILEGAFDITAEITK